MAVNAQFGIQTTVDDAAIKTLLGHLEKIPVHAKTISDAFKAAGENVAAAAQHISQSAEEKISAIQAKSKGRTIAELESELKLHEKSKKEIVALQKSYEEEVSSVAKKLTQTLDGEEKKRLKATQAELKSELAAVKEEAEKRGIESKKGASFDKGRHLDSGGIAQVAGIGAAIELFKVGSEKAKEFNDAQANLHAATGLNIKDAEEVGKSLGKTGEETADVMAKVEVATGAEGEELKKQTQAALAYTEATGKDASIKMATATGRAKIMADADMNIAIAQKKASETTKKAAFEMKELMETVSKVASVVMAAFAPAMAALEPMIETIGDLIGTTLKPALEALSPVVTKVAQLFAKMAPVIGELITNALQALSPILEVISDAASSLIDPLIAIAKTIGGALGPILKMLAPLLKDVGAIIISQLTGSLQMLLPVIAELLPPLMDLLVPVLKLLISIITPLADLLAGALQMAIKAVSAILIWIVDHAIKPLVDWFSGKLKAAIDDVVGTITKAVGAITKVVGAVTSFLGLGDKAAAGAKDAAQKAGEAGRDEAANQAKIDKGERDKRERLALADKLKYGKISAAEEQELREQAQEEGDQAMLAKLDAFDKKREALAAKTGKAGAKARAEAARAGFDQELADEKDAIAAQDITDREAKALTLKAEVEHQTSIRNIFAEGSKQYISENHKLQALLLAAKKEEHAALLAQNKNDTEDLLAEVDRRAIREGLSEKQIAQEKYDIQQRAITLEISLAKDGSEEKAKLQQQFADNELKHNAEVQKSKLEQQKESDAIDHDIEKQKLDARADSIAKELDLADFQYREELTKLRENLEAKKITQAQYDQLAEVARQNDLQQQKEIHKKEHDAQLATLDQISSASAVYGQAQQAINQKFFAPILDNWKNQKTFAMQALATITEGLLGYVEQWLAKKAAMLATSLVDSLLATATTTAAAAESAAAWAPAAISASIATLGAADAAGAAAFGAAQAAGQGVGHLAAGTDDWRGGLTFVGERGPELLNLPQRSQVIPNHHLPNLGAPPVDLTPLISRLDSIHLATLKANETFSQRPAPVLAVNDDFRTRIFISAKAEDRRST